MQVGDIMHREVVTVAADQTFAEAAVVLRNSGISSVVVRDGQQPAGIVTERDVVNLVADGGDPSSVRVGDRMSRDLATVAPRDDVADAARLMSERGVRHLPVVERGGLVGMVSIRDLIAWAVEELTGGHELPDIERSSAALSAAARIERSG
jgi:CBS domain-containing protein